VRWVHPDALQVISTEDARGGEAAAARQLFGKIEVLLSCGPVELAALWAPRCPRLRRVVCISTSSVHTKRASPDVRERELIERICAAEDRLKRFCAEREIALALLRPTLIYGCGMDQNISRLARLVRRFRFLPVAGKAAGLRQPVHAQDLAQLAVELAARGAAISVESAVGGGSVLSYRQMVQRIFIALGMKPRILQVPPWLLVLVVRCVAWLPFLRGLNAGFVLRQNCDQVFDDSHLRELTGFSPRPFAPTASDFETPESAASGLVRARLRAKESPHD
jgi:nucleoside-diphosphate-sugar epimerase